MKYKLIATDMDGTLLNSGKEVSQHNRAALIRAREMGIKVVIATGRIYTSAKMYAALLGIDTPIIACNGAIIKAAGSDETIQSTPIRSEDISKIVDILEESGVYYHFYGHEHFYTKELKYTSEHYSRLNLKLSAEERINIVVVDNVMESFSDGIVGEDILKFVAIDEDRERLSSVREKISRVSGVVTDKSWHNNLEIMARGVSKGQALAKLSGMMGIKKEEIICFGDNENDISLFENSGFRVAMENGEDVLKKGADFITSSNDDDGVAKALERFVLSR